MYPLSHVYCATEVARIKNPYFILGCNFPDFFQVEGLPKGFGDRAADLMNFFEWRYPELYPFAVGMALHEVPIGVDRFIHTNYKGGLGYAFQFSEALSPDASKVFTPEALDLMMHFLVENALEIKIVNEHPDARDLLKNCFNNIDEDKLISALTEFYKVEESGIKEELKLFKHQVLDFDASKPEELANLWVELMHRAFGMSADVNALASLIKKTQKVIEPTIDLFLKETIAACREDYTNFKKKEELLKE